MYKISIILPVFNVENYVKKAFKSILNQTIGFENLEVIFVDDCSTDNSASIIQDFVNKFDNVKYFCLEENSSAAGKPRNVGIANASADYIMFLDPDDEFFEDACEKLYTHILNDDVDVVSGNYVKIQGKDTTKNTWRKLKLKDNEIKIKSLPGNPHILKYPPSVWTKIFKKDIILENNIKFPIGVPAQDFYFVCHYFLKANGILFIDVPIAKHRHNANGTSIKSKRDKKTLSGFIKVYNDSYQLFEEENRNLKWLAAFNLYSWSKLFVFSDLNKKDKIDLLYQAHNLYAKVKSSSKLHYKKGYESFYEKICEKDYYGAIEEAEMIKLVSSIKSRNIFMIFAGCELEIGRLAKAVFNRANLLSKNGYENITLLNIDTFRNEDIFDNFKNYKYMESFFKDNGHLDESIQLINIFDYFSDRNTLNFNQKVYSDDFLKLTENLDEKLDLLDVNLKFNDKFFIHDKYVIEREVTEDHQVILKYYEKSSLRKKITSLYNLDKLVFIKDFSISKKDAPIKSETYINNSLAVETFHNNKNVKLYTQDGFNYCSINEIDGKILFNLNDRHSHCSYHLNYKDFYEYFTMKICLESSQKPFLINDCNGSRPSIAKIPSDLAYKISKLHCNHHKNPFNCGSEIKTLGSFEDLDDLDALVLLTKSQKNDFKKEFDFKRVYNIPHFMPDDTLESTSFNKRNFNKNKISVFSRTDPQKNIRDIIQAFKKVVKSKPDAILEIFTPNLKKHEVKEYNKLMKLVDELNIQDNVIFRVNATDIYKEMANSLVTVSTSKTEGLNFVLLESMINNTPVISYDTHYGPRDVIDNDKDGCIIEEGNISDLSEKMLNFLNNPSTAIEMGKSARNKIIKEYSEKPTLKRWEKLFKQVCLDSRDNKNDIDSGEMVSGKGNDNVSDKYPNNVPSGKLVDSSLVEKNTLLIAENSKLNLNLKSLEQEIIRLNHEIEYLKNKKITVKDVLNKI